MDSKLQQKALQQPKQKKSKSAEFLMEEEEEGVEGDGTMSGLENPAFDGEQSEIGVDRPASTLVAHPKKKMKLRAPDEERGNDFNPSSTEPRQWRTAGVSGEDELELTEADANTLYEKMTELLQDEASINIPGMPPASRDEEVLEVKAGDLMLHAAAGTSQAEGGGRCADRRRAEGPAIPRYTQQLRERVRSDMITLGSLSLQQGVPSDVPQPVEVNIACLRATRDKLPRGLYAVSVTLHSRLGAPPLAWCCEKEQPAGMVSTGPTKHGGRFYDIDLNFYQSLFMSLPSTSDISPSMVLVFQLVSVPGDSGHSSTGTVHAWGAFPVCGLRLTLIQGRFKTPLLRGEPSKRLDQFKKMESLISSDPDHWLCNLYFQVKRLQPGSSGVAKQCIATRGAFRSPSGMPQYETNRDRLQNPPSLRDQPSHQLSHAGLSCRSGEPTIVLSHRGSPLHLSADSACSTSSLPGSGAITGNVGKKSDACREKILHKKKPIKKTNSCAPPRHAHTHNAPPSVERLSAEEMEECMFSLRSELPGSGGGSSCLSHRARLALRMLPSELGLHFLGRPQQQQQQQHTGVAGVGGRVLCAELGLIMLLLALMWFVRLYLHYCSQWLYLQARALPVNKLRFHAHTVDLVYQSSVLHTREELAVVLVGPLTLNAVTLLLVLIRCSCQQIFGSVPSFTSTLITAQGVWTVLHPLALFAVDAVLGRLSYSADRPVADAAKLYWHFHQTDQSGVAGVIITLFVYGVHFLLSITILSVFLLRFHNDGRMLDVFQRLTAREGTYFLPLDLELSNQELSYIVKKSEQWRGFNGERRKVVVKESVWTAEEPLSTHTDGDPQRHVAPAVVETSVDVSVYTLYLSGLRQIHRRFLRHPDGAIVEVIGDVEGAESSLDQRTYKEGAEPSLKPRKRRQILTRSNRVEPAGGSGCGSG